MLSIQESYEGRGVLESEDSCHVFTVQFTLRRFHWHFEITVQVTHEDAQTFSLATVKLWRLSGTLADDRPLTADRLMCASTSPVIVLLPLQAIEIGKRGTGSIRSATYPLVGMYYGTNCRVEFDDCKLAIQDAQAWTEHTRQQARAMGRSLEGKALVLSSLPEGITVDGCFERAYGATRLLTLASGEGVTVHRQIVDWQSGERVEIWRQAKGDEVGPGTLIPAWYLEDFIKTSSVEWAAWSSDKKSLVTRVLSYLNMSTAGYLDIRLLYMMQALESLANTWVEEPKLDDGRARLRKNLLATYREWHKDEGIDDGGFWGSRISSLFNWPKLRQQLETLFLSRDVGLAVIGLDLDVLKDARNGVAHFGILPEKLGANPQAALRHLQAAQFALQLLLLSEMRYTGEIYDGTSSSWRTVVKRDHYAS